MGSVAPVRSGEIILGKYRVESLLGQGGMGVVVAARHIDLDELFAIKLMLPAFAQNKEATERFLREARAAAKLKGDHVARVQDVGRLPDGTSYMVMEYLTGTDLRHLVRTRGPLPLGDAVTYVLQACETLREAHGLGIVHRDIKPANIFLTRGPNGAPRVKVIDFGISKQIGLDAVDLTTTGMVGGSAFYMSPEQMRSSKHVDHRTDIWAIGAVLYVLLTGVTPFHAETITAVAGRVLQDDPLPPSRLRAVVSPELDAVVLRCLAKREDERFQTVDELMAALLRISAASAPLAPAAPDGPTLSLAPVSAAFLPAPASAPLDSALASAPLDPAPPPPPDSAGAAGAASTTASFGQVTTLTPAVPAVEAPARARIAPRIAAVAIAGLAAAALLVAWLLAPASPATTLPPTAAASSAEAAGSSANAPVPEAPPPGTITAVTVPPPSPAAATVATATTAAPRPSPTAAARPAPRTVRKPEPLY